MTKRKRETWTFQPDDAVIALAKGLFGDKPDRGQRTQLINDAIRFKHPDAALLAAHVVSAQREVDEANERLERMKKMLAKLKESSASSTSTSEEEGIAAAAEEASQPGYPSSSHSPSTAAPTERKHEPSRVVSRGSKGKQSSAKQVPK
jgi:hypothetical protein